MAWPVIPDLIYTDRVKVRTVTWDTKDRAGGRVQSASAWSGSTYRCSVSATSVTPAQMARDQVIITHVVTADTKIGNLRDQLQWQETGGVLTITGIEPAGDANGRVWEHFTEEYMAR